MYHRVCKEGEGDLSPYVVNVEVFERQLQYFLGHGYYTPRLADVLANRFDVADRTKKPFIITFDDGYLDTLKNAVPLIREYGFLANVFILPAIRTNSWDAPKGIKEAKLMDEIQFLDLKALGVEIGSHGWSHRSLPLLADDDLANEFQQSKKTAEEILQQPVQYFAYPYGDVDERVKAAARKAGFVCAFATNSGPIWFHRDLHQIRRTIICNRADNPYLFVKLSGIEKTLRVGWSMAKNILGRPPRHNTV
jgi:peptidoglycan/xylan/chitin deacetylase (PgdA/CDA1 family)